VHNTGITGNFTLTADASISCNKSWDDFSIVCNFTDLNNYYYVNFNEQNDGNTRGIFKVVSGVQTQLADITSSISCGTTYEIKVERSGNTIRAYRNGTLVATATDSVFAGGKVGFGSRNDPCVFDNLIVRQ